MAYRVLFRRIDFSEGLLTALRHEHRVVTEAHRAARRPGGRRRHLRERAVGDGEPGHGIRPHRLRPRALGVGAAGRGKRKFKIFQI